MGDPSKTFLQNITPALIAFVGVLIGLIPAVFISILQKVTTQKEQIAAALAEFYAASATVYYGKSEIQKARQDKALDDSPRLLDLYKIYDTHYQEFLTASTKLAAKVPPKHRETILTIEDLWDEILQAPLDKAAETKWFHRLDAIREEIFRVRLPIIRS